MWLINAGGSSIKLRACAGTDCAVDVELKAIGLSAQTIHVHSQGQVVQSFTCSISVNEAAKFVCDTALAICGQKTPQSIFYRSKFGKHLQVVEPLDQVCLARLKDEALFNVDHALLTISMHLTLSAAFPNAAHYCISDSGLFLSSGFAERLPMPDALQRRYEVEGIGHHGLACESIMDLLAREGVDASRLIAVHLGSGVTVSAFADSRPIFNTMLYSAYDGPVMNTRAGTVPTGALLRLLRGGFPIDELVPLMAQRSGIYALTGEDPAGNITVQQLLDGKQSEGALVYVARIVDHILAAMSRLPNPDVITFSGGLATSSGVVSQILKRLGIRALQALPGGAMADERLWLVASEPACFVARVDEFSVMERYARTGSAFAAPLYGECICPGTVKARLNWGSKGAMPYVASADRLSPEFVLRNQDAAAFVVTTGHPTMHGAAMARELRIPCIAGVDVEQLHEYAGLRLLYVDATAGVIRHAD